MSAATCHDCQGRFDRDTMHLIKADTLSGRALICNPCHLDEVERITRFNREMRDRRIKAEAWDECTDYVSRHFEDYLPDGWSQQADGANPYRQEADA